MERWRDGGTEQTGTLAGGRIGYDYIEPGRWYFGADFLYATGPLEGHSGSGKKLHSNITDWNVEGRFGLTLPPPFLREDVFFTPFVGYGYFHEENSFHSPSPISFTFTDTFSYVAAGFLSGANLHPLLSMGVNFKVRFMLNAQSEVSDDPVYDHVTLQVEDELQVRIEVPFSYCYSCCFDIALVPFYEFRHFGGREGYPFDFLDTKYNLFGARASLAYRF